MKISSCQLRGSRRLSLRRIGDGPRREPVVDPGLGWNPPRHQRGPAGRADGRTDETVLEPGAAGRQTIDLGSSDHPVAVTPGHPGGQIIGDDEQDVGTPVLTREQSGNPQGGTGQGCGRLQDRPGETGSWREEGLFGLDRGSELMGKFQVRTVHWTVSPAKGIEGVWYK